MKNLITGIHGFAASHLADFLLEQNEEVFGIARSLDNDLNINHIQDQIQVSLCNIRDRSAIKKILEAVRPDRIYHLASVSFVPQAEKEGDTSFETIFNGTWNVLESVRELGLNCRILSVGSSEAYGMAGEGRVKEDRALQPISLYGVSKAAAELLAHSYFVRDGLDVIRTRPYNHTGPRQDSRFVCSSFARQIAAIEKGAKAVIKTGNLESYRDFMDVRDTVSAYHAIMEHGKAGEVFNVCSGEVTSVQVILETLLEISGVSIRIETDPKLFREAKPVSAFGDNSFLRQRTGWGPEFGLEQTLCDLLDHWREIL
ncbi:MAG: GDP-mannose 4,6-dehydratase [Nitrospinae bacterium]|nr:GDP-mannose 4,6-dehydratase [Nitrospinota bacterium]MDA1109392.1 GDP-mannose 4,6-dehydratase [Nitrospinota bacterium]